MLNASGDNGTYICKLPYLRLYAYSIHEKNISGGARQAIAIPGQRCFELISSHQQGICKACLAHHQFINMYTCI